MNPNDDLDRTIHDALHREADRPMPTPDFHDVRRRAERGERARPWVPATAAAAVVLVALLIGAVALTGGDDDDTNVVTDPDQSSTSVSEPDDSTTTTLEDGPTTTSPAEPDITAVVGEDFDGIEVPQGDPLPDGQFIGTLVRQVPGNELPSLDIVRFDGDGEQLETLEESFGSPAEGGTYGYELSPDRRTVYFVTSGAACLSSVWAMPADGSSEPVQVSDRAHDVTVSPDGAHLALTYGDICDAPDGVPPTIEIVPVNGGQIQRFVLQDAPTNGPGSSIWIDEASLVVSTIGEESALYDLDPAAGTGTRIDSAPGTTIVELTAGSDGRVVGARTTGSPFEQGEVRIVRYDDGTLSEVFDSPQLPEGSLTDLDVLADGRISAIVFTEGTGSGWYLDGDLLRNDVDDVTT